MGRHHPASEVRALASAPTWRVGIGQPRPDAAPDEIYRVVPLVDAALATSGDYRIFFESGGVRHSHVFDPRTGRPVENGVVSISVLAPDCTLADGLATAVMVMGKDAGLALLERLPDVEGLVVVGRPAGGGIAGLVGGHPGGDLPEIGSDQGSPSGQQAVADRARHLGQRDERPFREAAGHPRPGCHGGGPHALEHGAAGPGRLDAAREAPGLSKEEGTHA